jgi:hypothetical protein
MYLALRLYKIIQFIYNPVYFFYFVSWLIIAIAIVFTIIFTQILILYVNNRMKIKITCIKYSIQYIYYYYCNMMIIYNNNNYNYYNNNNRVNQS